MSALRTPSGERTGMPTAAPTRAVRSLRPMALRPSRARAAVDERRAPEAAARGRGRAPTGRTAQRVDGARRDVRAVPCAAHESERSRGRPADRGDESPATTRQLRSIAGELLTATPRRTGDGGAGRAAARPWSMARRLPA